MKHPLVLVRWRDAHFELDRPKDHVWPEDYVIETVGFLLSEGPVFVELAAEKLPHGDGWRAATRIALESVQGKIVRL